jgi:hypothetical protein
VGFEIDIPIGGTCEAIVPQNTGLPDEVLTDARSLLQLIQPVADGHTTHVVDFGQVLERVYRWPVLMPPKSECLVEVCRLRHTVISFPNTMNFGLVQK